MPHCPCMHTICSSPDSVQRRLRHGDLQEPGPPMHRQSRARNGAEKVSRANHHVDSCLPAEGPRRITCLVSQSFVNVAAALSQDTNVQFEALRTTIVRTLCSDTRISIPCNLTQKSKAALRRAALSMGLALASSSVFGLPLRSTL